MGAAGEALLVKRNKHAPLISISKSNFFVFGWNRTRCDTYILFSQSLALKLNTFSQVSAIHNLSKTPVFKSTGALMPAECNVETGCKHSKGEGVKSNTK